MQKALFCSIFFIVALVMGCASQLTVKRVMVNPPQLAAGDDAKIFVIFNGPKNKVASVIATVRENPEIYYTLNDHGTKGDEKANDNIWTSAATVPSDAPADIYHLDIRAIDNDGHEIVTKGLEQLNTGHSGTVEVTVK